MSSGNKRTHNFIRRSSKPANKLTVLTVFHPHQKEISIPFQAKQTTLTKKQVFEQIETELKVKIDETQQEISSLQKEMSEETKSSAGDKFETSREMMNQSINQLQDNLQQQKKQLQQLKELKNNKSTEKVGMGSFVCTEKANFLFGLAFGKINSAKENIFVLSLNSPLGRLFLDKKVGDTVQMNQNNYTIKSIE